MNNVQFSRIDTRRIILKAMKKLKKRIWRKKTRVHFNKPISGLLIWTLSNTDTKSQRQRVNSYKLNLFIKDTAVIRWIPNPDQVNLHRVNPILLMSYTSPVAVYQTMIHESFTEEHNWLFEGLNNYR